MMLDTFFVFHKGTTGFWHAKKVLPSCKRFLELYLCGINAIQT